MRNIEKARKALGLKQSEVCRGVGITPKCYNLYTVHGKPIPSDKLIKFSKILRCSVDYLLGLEEKKENLILSDNVTKITVIDGEKELAVITSDEITTASPNILVKLTPRYD